MTDLSFSLLSWLQETGQIPDVGGFIEIDDCECIINAFTTLFPEVQLNQKELIKSFLKFIVNNKPKNYKSIVPITLDDFITCVPDVLEEISKIILLLFIKKDEETFYQQLNKLPRQVQDDLKIFLTPKINESEELNRLSQQIRNFSQILEMNMSLDRQIYQLDQKNDMFFQTSDILVQDTKHEVNQEINNQKESIEELMYFNEIREKGIQHVKAQIEHLQSEVDKKEITIQDRLARVISEQQRLKDELAPYDTLEEMIRNTEPPYAEMVRKFIQLENQINQLKDEKAFYEEKIFSFKRSDSNGDISSNGELMSRARTLVLLKEKMSQLEYQWTSNIKFLENQKKTGSIQKLIQRLILERTKRDDIKKKLKQVRKSTLVAYYELCGDK